MNPRTDITKPRADRGRDNVDVLIVGARCAGAATGMLLADAGHDVLIVDRALPGTDALSTHGIARTGMVQLQRWGLVDAVVRSGAPRVTEVRFNTPSGVIERTIRDRCGVDHLLAPRRRELDRTLQHAAVERGATLRFGTAFRDVLRDDRGGVTGAVIEDEAGPREITARMVVGADGLRSRMARSVDAPIIESRPAVGATHFAYFRGSWDAMEYFGGPNGFAGVFPTHDHEACIWVCTPSAEAMAVRRDSADLDTAFSTLLRNAAPELAERTVGRPERQASRAQGMVKMPNHVRRSHGRGWALVGDAAYHRDAITGHGISDAFRDAELLARAVDRALCDEASATKALRAYSADQRRMLRPMFELTWCLLNAESPAEFFEHQRELSAAIEIQAEELSTWSTPRRLEPIAA